MNRFALPAAVITLVAATIAAAPSVQKAAPDTDENYTIPSALATVNPCNGDAVALVGDLHFLVHTTDSNNGNIHGYYSFNGRYSGVGVPSTLNYQGSEDYLDDYTITNGAAFVESVSQDFSLVSQTGQDNYWVRVHYKITITANGVPSAEITDFNSYCTG